MGIIKVQNLGKKYIISHKTNRASYSTLRETITNGIKNLGTALFKKGNNPAKEEFWALKEIDFEVQQGDRVGIIGRNGAGKTTLLKLLSRITDPTTGRIELNGRVASLLEVGTGFHPELTGRENIFLNGAILGMKRKEIKRKFDEIVAFAEVEKFLDTPVKRYSSGMYVRLAFAVAAHLEPEILIVDEVLAVGDAAFQKKCLGKMEEVSTKDGRTVLFVSHNMNAVTRLCTRSILLENGGIILDGTTHEAVLQYYSSDLKSGFSSFDLTNSTKPVGDEHAILLQGAIENSEGTTENKIAINDSFMIRMRYQVFERNSAPVVPNFHFFTESGQYAFIDFAKGIKQSTPGVYDALCKVPGNLLNEGVYSIGLALTTFSKLNQKVHFFERGALSVHIADEKEQVAEEYGYTGTLPGAVRPQLTWHIEKVE